MSEKESQEKQGILDVYSNFEELLKLIESISEYPNQINVKCNFDLYSINCNLEYEVFCEKLNVYAASITALNDFNTSIVFLVLNKDQRRKESIGITVDKFMLKNLRLLD